MVCTTPYLVGPSPAGSKASSGSVNPEILAAKIFRLQRMGEEYSDALEQFTNSLCQVLFNRRQDMAETIEQTEALLVGLGDWARVEEGDDSEDREEENKENAPSLTLESSSDESDAGVAAAASWSPLLYREPPSLAYPTCPLEIEIRRRNFEDRALLVPEVEVDHLENESLEIERLRRQFEERALQAPKTTQTYRS